MLDVVERLRMPEVDAVRASDLDLEAAAEIIALRSKLDQIRELLYGDFANGKISELVAVGRIERILREPK